MDLIAASSSESDRVDLRRLASLQQDIYILERRAKQEARRESRTTFRIKLGGIGELSFEADRDVHIQVHHWGAGVGTQQFFPNSQYPDSLVRANNPKLIRFRAEPPAGVNYFVVYASAVSYTKNDETISLSEEVRTRGSAYIVSVLTPQPSSGAKISVKSSTVSYRSGE